MGCAPCLAHLHGNLTAEMPLKHPMHRIADDAYAIPLEESLPHRWAGREAQEPGEVPRIRQTRDGGTHYREQTGAVEIGTTAEQPAQAGTQREEPAIKELGGEDGLTPQFGQGLFQQLDLLGRYFAGRRGFQSAQSRVARRGFTAARGRCPLRSAVAPATIVTSTFCDTHRTARR